jgi:hypothetical protein
VEAGGGKWAGGFRAAMPAAWAAPVTVTRRRLSPDTVRKSIRMQPDIIARIRLFTLEEGGRSQPIPPIQFGCPLFLEGQRQGHDCRLLLDHVGVELNPGSTVDIPIKFPFPQDAVPCLRLGDKFRLWEGRDIAQGEVLRIL